jgi:hypothetical protein
MPTLDIERGLSYFDCGMTAEGRESFHQYVSSRSTAPCEPSLSGRTALSERCAARRAFGPTVEVATPYVKRDGVSYPIVQHPNGRLAPGYDASIGEFVRAYGALRSLPPEALRDRGRERWRTQERRLSLLVWRGLARPTSELAAWLDLSGPSATKLVRRASVDDRQTVSDICAHLLAIRDRVEKL